MKVFFIFDAFAPEINSVEHTRYGMLSITGPAFRNGAGAVLER